MKVKEYNSERERLVFPEYGRHIQNMVTALSTIEDREERTQQAYVVIEVMGNLNHCLRDTDDFKHKLWDHLFLLAQFNLDVDSPYDIPTQEELSPKPQPIAYPKRSMSHKQYGKNIKQVIDLIKTKENSEQKSDMISDIAKFMKYKSYEYNQEYPSDEVVLNDLLNFSKGELEIDDDALTGTRINTNKKLRTSPRKETSRGSHRPSSSVQSGRKFSKGTLQQQAPKRYFRRKGE